VNRGGLHHLGARLYEPRLFVSLWMRYRAAGVVLGLGTRDEATFFVWGLGDMKRACWDRLGM